MTRFCTVCRTPWALRAVIDGELLVIMCRACGHVRASVPLSTGTSGAAVVGDLSGEAAAEFHEVPPDIVNLRQRRAT